ncbi:NADP-dependent oxidoreductase [Glycomyces sp. A-F 0318]|uniref:NADP-dependent oxidoreductase n=1 Tax=Glycomyces amatae TaxID=2881355 RepID=UPI001E51B819|nr:NADP-dependent oxidoreductase [Glycomyces amatae]MCD0445428.1 NADP-dependent oxidoreductase [Glycomyces amatae]
MTVPVNRQWILTARPRGPVDEGCFELRTGPVPEPGPGEALVRVVWLGFDPTQRGWLNEGDNYLDPVPLGEVMRGSGVGRVVASRNPGLAVGDWVAGMVGWQDYAIAAEDGLFGLNRVPDGVDPKAMLGVFGSTGLTAYFGMVDIGRPREGETVFVTGAAGATGSVAGQIAKLLGCKVIGSAGGPAKCEWAVGTAGFDACVDYRSEDLEARLRELAPGGLDVVFDGVGGAVLDAALANLALRARVVVVGGISSGYDGGEPPPGPRNYLRLGIRRARMEGFVFLDYLERFPEAFGRLGEWVGSGRLVYAEDVREGLERAPAVLRGLFEGGNLGKQLLRVADPEAVGAA